MEQYYQVELTKLRKARGNWREIKASFIRMRQLSSGFLGLKNDETGERAEIEFPENPKIDELLNIIDAMPTDAKIIVFHEYVLTGKRISQALKAAKIPHARLYGGQKNPKHELRKFQTDPACKAIVINNHSGSMMLNLQAANYVAFVESSVRPIIRMQAERRARRGGQIAKRVFIYDIVAKTPSGNSVDEKILAWLAEGKNLMRDVLAAKVDL
jgi:SNF2 family DNA or RNA helicase